MTLLQRTEKGEHEEQEQLLLTYEIVLERKFFCSELHSGTDANCSKGIRCYYRDRVGIFAGTQSSI